MRITLWSLLAVEIRALSSWDPFPGLPKTTFATIYIRDITMCCKFISDVLQDY